jgi:hypothetical protein
MSESLESLSDVLQLALGSSQADGARSERLRELVLHAGRPALSDELQKHSRTGTSLIQFVRVILSGIFPVFCSL